MSCTRAYLMQELKNRLGDHFVVSRNRVVHKRPSSVELPSGFFKRIFFQLCGLRVVERPVLFEYEFIGACNQVNVWVHSGFDEHHAEQLFETVPVRVNAIQDVRPDPWVTEEYGHV